MSEEKVIPFRPRPREISDGELEVFLQATRNWPPQLRELMFPEYVKAERERSKE